MYRVFKALTATEFLRRGHVEGEYIANNVLTSKPEKEVGNACWEWLKQFDRTKNRGATPAEQVFLQMHRQPQKVKVEARAAEPSAVPVPLVAERPDNGGDKSKNITALVEAMKTVQMLKNNLRPDGLLDAMDSLIEEVTSLKSENSQLRKELAVSRADVGQLKSKLRVMSEDYTKVVTERDELQQENTTLHSKLAANR